jgi:hypothetical protein
MSLASRKDILSIPKGMEIFSKYFMWYNKFTFSACSFPLTTQTILVLRSVGIYNSVHENENNKSHPVTFPMKIYP